MQEFKVRLRGVSPLMFHNERLADPSDPITRELKKLTKERNKTDELYEQIKWVEWRGGFYEHEGRPVMPADNVLAVGLEGARKRKQGKEFSAAVFEAQAFFDLEYDGPKTIDKLRGNKKFLDYRGVVVNRRRTMRARPIFREWALTVALLFDREIIEEASIWQAYEIAGERIGIAERRPRHGRFILEEVKAKSAAT